VAELRQLNGEIKMAKDKTMIIRISEPVVQKLQKHLEQQKKATGIFTPAVAYVNQAVSNQLKLDAQINADSNEST
jgi:hypothetical protein